MLITWQLGVALVNHSLWQPVVIIACCPLWTVATCAAHLIEQSLTTLYIRVIKVAGTRDRKTAVPYHECIELLVAHLWREVVDAVVELVCLRAQKSLDSVGNTSIGTISIVR